MCAQTEPIRIEYRAVAGCPSAEEFTAEVMKRTAGARLAPNDDRARTFIVEIDTRRGTLTGSLRVREARSATVAREVQGGRCSDIASTLALATALAIDPHAAATPSPTKPAGGTASSAGGAGRDTGSDARSSDAMGDGDRSSKTGGGAEASGSSSAGGSELARAGASPSGEAGRGAGARSGAGRADAAPSGRAENDVGGSDEGLSHASSSDARGARVAVGVGPSVLTGVTPNAAFGVSLSAWWTNARAPAWLTSYGSELTWLHAPQSEAAGASVTFHMLHVRPVACGIRLGSYDGVSLSPCVGAELGLLSGWGSDLPREEGHTKLWAALDVFARLRIGAKNEWSLEAEAGPTVPLTRYEFVFHAPETQIHTVARVAFAAGVRVSVPLNR